MPVPRVARPATNAIGSSCLNARTVNCVRACRLVGVDSKTVRRDRPPDNPEIRAEMKAVAHKRRRFGYWRTCVMLERKGMTMNYKKLYRLYTEEKLGVRHRRGRKRARGSRTPMADEGRDVDAEHMRLRWSRYPKPTLSNTLYAWQSGDAGRLRNTEG